MGGGATAAGMGHIVVMDDSEAQFALTRYSQLLWSEIAPSLPTNAEYETPGTLWLAADDEEMAEAERKQTVLSRAQRACTAFERSRTCGTRAKYQVRARWCIACSRGCSHLSPDGCALILFI